MSTNVIESFLISLGFQTETEGLQTLRDRTEAAKQQLLSIVAVAAAAASAIGLFVGSVAASLDELGDFAEAEDYSASKLVELGYAAQMTGSDLDAVKQSLLGVNKTVGEAALGIGRGAMTFQKLGMQAKNANGVVKSFDEILDEVSVKMSKLSRKESIAMAEKLGIDRSLVPMLMKGKDAIAALRAEAQAFGSSTDEDFEIAGGFQDSVDRTQFMLKSMTNFIAVRLMPQVKLVIDQFRDWMMLNRDMIRNSIVSSIKLVTAAIGILWDWVTRIVGQFSKLITWLGTFKIAVWAAVVALGAFVAIQIGAFAQNLAGALAMLTVRILAFNAASMFIPLVIGLIVAAIALLADEVVNFLEGNDSFLGDLIAQYPQLMTVVNAVAAQVKTVAAWLVKLWAGVEPSVIRLVGALGKLYTALIPVFRFLWEGTKQVVAGWMAIAEVMLPIILNIAVYLVEHLTAAITAVVDAFTWIVEALTWVVEKVTGFSTWFVATWTDMAGTLQKVFTGAFTAIADWAKSKFEAMTGWVSGFIGKVSDAVGWVGNLLGGDTGSVEQSGSMASVLRRSSDARLMQPGGGNASPAGPVAPPSFLQPTSATGVAANPTNASRGVSSTNTQSTQVTAPITIYSTDPETSGRAVREELNRAARNSTRNGQSAVAL